MRVQRKKREDHDHIRILQYEHERVCESLDDVANALAELEFAPSCVDMGWEWDVEEVFSVDRPDPRGGNFEPRYAPAGYRIRTTFRRPERTTGEIQTGEGRWWEVPLKVTESGVVKTAFAAAKLILEHELMESFKWRGNRVFDPHHSIRELASIQPGRYTDSIP